MLRKKISQRVYFKEPSKCQVRRICYLKFGLHRGRRSSNQTLFEFKRIKGKDNMVLPPPKSPPPPPPPSGNG